MRSSYDYPHTKHAMTAIRKTVTLTKQQDQWVKAQISAGRFTNDSEYIRDLVRRDQERHTSALGLRQAVQDGLDSGIYEGNAFEDARETIRKTQSE